MILPITNSSVEAVGEKWHATCVCGKKSIFATKSNALKMVLRGDCRNCKRHYRSVVASESRLHRRGDGRWCCFCSGCGKEQAYTRKDHARQSEVSDWQCKKCVATSKGFSQNRPVGASQRIYNRFRKSAISRGIPWELTIEDLFSVYTARCSLTGWSINIEGSNPTASVDRIDSSRGYVLQNIQWVHTMVNMCKNKYPQDDFIRMCHAVASTSEYPQLRSVA